MWGAGGATDVVARAVTPHAEEALGKKIVLVNKSGGTGAISTNFVNNAPSDGYTLLYGAENPQLHQVLALADFGYEKFYPVNVFGRGIAVIVVKSRRAVEFASRTSSRTRRSARASSRWVPPGPAGCRTRSARC